MDYISDMFSDLGSLILDKLNEFVGMLFFWLTAGVLKLLKLCESLFDVFSGTTKVLYEKQPEYLIDVFFKTDAINNVYWAMALLGIVFVVAFSIVAVTRKTFDIHDSQKQTMGGILGSMFKSILTILVLSMIMSSALTITNRLVATLGDIFNSADSYGRGGPVAYTNEDYATMARVYKTIGNYSLNPSYSSKYNMNSCFNDIRQDLLYLQDRGVFDEVYPVPGKDDDDSDVPVTWNWQNVLEMIVYTTDLNRELKIDSENEDLFQALELAMNQIRTNSSFYPLDHFSQEYAVSGKTVSIANVIFLSGTGDAARNPNYNRDPYITDGLRGAYYRGQKNIADYDTVKRDFNTSLIGGINYILIAVLAYFTIKSLFRCIVACISRIINMAGLYIIAPLAISTMPADEGAKFKQWTTSMVVQMLGIFGYIIPMRLLILFVPILMGPDLILMDSVFMNFVAKAFLVVGSVFAIQEFSGIINGILADMAGHAALDSGKSVMRSASKFAGNVGGKTWTATKFLGKNVAAPVVGGVLGAGGAGVVGSAQWIGGKLKQGWNWTKDKFSSKPSAKGTPDNLKGAGGDSGGSSAGGDSGGQPKNLQGGAESDKQSQTSGQGPQDSDNGTDNGSSPTNYGASGSAPESDKQSQAGNTGNQAPGGSSDTGNGPNPTNYGTSTATNESDKQTQAGTTGTQAPGTGSGTGTGTGSGSGSGGAGKTINFSAMATGSAFANAPAPNAPGQPSTNPQPGSGTQTNANPQQGTAPAQPAPKQTAPLKSPPPKTLPPKNYNGKQ